MINKNVYKTPPRTLNEIIKFDIDITDYKPIGRIPIDSRFLIIESIFANHFYSEGKITVDDLLYSPLFASSAFLKEYLRINTAIHSTYYDLYCNQHKAYLNDKTTNWCLCQYKKEKLDVFLNDCLKMMNSKDRQTILKNIDYIWTDVFLSNTVYKDQVLMFNVQSIYIDVYSLGSILEYRFKEGMKDIIKPPKKYLNHNNGQLCIDPC